MAYLNFIERYPLASLAVFFIVVPLVSAIYQYHYLDKAFRLLLIFLSVDLILGLWMFYLAANRTNNIPLLNIFVPVRYIFLSGMFYYYFRSEKIKRIIKYTIIGFIPFTLIDVYTSNADLTDLHNHMVGKYSQVVESGLIILWGLLYFYEIIKNLKVPSLTSFPFFWVCAGLLFYYSGNIFFYPFWYYMYKWENDLHLGLIEEIPYVVEIVSLLLFAVGIWNIRSLHDKPEL